MNFQQSDIEKSRFHFLAMQENGTLKLKAHKMSEFVNFFIDNITPDLLKETLLLTIQSYSLSELQVLAERFKYEDEFDNLISKAFKAEKRKQLKKHLIQLDETNEELSFDETITKAFKIEKREELKQKLKAFDIESKPRKVQVISIRTYFNVMSIAASIIIVFLIWQPQKLSNSILFDQYSSHIDDNSLSDYAQTEFLREPSELRGEEEHFKNFSYNETLQLLEAIALIKEKDFENAKEVFNRLHVEKEKNPGLTLYLAIAQLNTGDVDEATINLEFLNQLPGFLYPDDAKFHLAFAYLKVGKRKNAKELLDALVNSKSKFADEAQNTLNKIRWF